MISSITIQGYRGFEHFEMSGLGRVNLLVGPNNGGKSSVLESILLLMSGGNPVVLWRVLLRRGECLVTEQRGNPPTLRTDAEVRHLFRGHEILPGAAFAVSATNQLSSRSVEFTVQETSAANEGMTERGLALGIAGHPTPDVPRVRLTPTGELHEAVHIFRRPPGAGEPSIFVASESLPIDELIGLWNGVTLTPAETLVLKALQFIDPEIERIAVQVATANSYYRSGSRGGFIVKRRGTERPIPIGSLGDGVWRMLVMAIAITQCRGGVLLVDEIDTGLHHSIMSEMWQLIYNTAKELDVQVFATTHSYDCVYSLAPLCASADEQNPITVQRIEPGKSAAIPYALNQVRIAAEHQIEVR